MEKPTIYSEEESRNCPCCDHKLFEHDDGIYQWLECSKCFFSAPNASWSEKNDPYAVFDEMIAKIRKGK